MHGSAVLRYTVARLALFLATLGLLSLTGLRGLFLAALALLISGLVSAWALSAQRDSMSMALSGALSGALHHRIRRIRRTLDEGAAAEDERDEEARRHPDGSG